MKSKEEWKVYGNVFSKHSLALLFSLSSKGYFDELESPVSVGKEANVFTAITKDDKRIIAKIYRLENCNFNKMYEYLRDDPRYVSVSRNSRQVIFTWVQREYRNLLIAREAIKVPTPIAVKDNILLMEFIGSNDPAPELKDAPPKDPQKFFDKILINMKKLYRQGLIHADLSPFNILNHDEEPIFIDFSQASPTNAQNAQTLLKRDLHNICVHFRKFLKITDSQENKMFEKIVKK
jgi:RIO kinase 1